MTDPTILIGVLEISIELARLYAEGEKLILIATGIFIIFIILILALTMTRGRR